jgi:KDO2-lipid IV(A) lauroyltransferase
MKDALEHAFVWLLAWVLRLLPRRVAHALGLAVGRLVYRLHARLRRVGERNLEMAFPEKTPAERAQLLRGVFASLGHLLAELPRIPSYTAQTVSRVAVHENLENFLDAERRGKGVLFLTAHIGGWEVGAAMHSLLGHPLHVVMRPLDNPRLDRLARELRCCHGNRVIEKHNFARGAMQALKRGETVGVLMDTNMTPPEGIFCDFFGIKACTTSAIARLALHTGAAVVPAFTLWDEEQHRYRIHFEPMIEMIHGSDDDVAANTQRFNDVIEAAIRRHPSQWLWVHRRWKTRPDGESALY